MAIEYADGRGVRLDATTEMHQTTDGDCIIVNRDANGVATGTVYIRRAALPEAGKQVLAAHVWAGRGKLKGSL